MKAPQLYLASKSPRRAELLRQIDIAFEVISVDIDESVQPGETPRDYVQRLAVQKALAGWRAIGDDKAPLPVLGADTSVVLGERILGKPSNREDALRMLGLLSGQTHQVMTAVSLQAQGFSQSVVSVSEVSFRALSDAEAEAYWETGEPVDKAGAYAVQGRAAVFVRELRGSFSGVVGLPLMETDALLQAWKQQRLQTSGAN